MSDFWWGALVVAGVWVYFSFRSKVKATGAFSSLNEAEPWLLQRGMRQGSARFSSYDDPGLVRNAGATILVGVAENGSGGLVGFALEVLPGRGVVSSEVLIPYGIATHHKTASMQARASGRPLLDVLRERSRA